MSVFCVGVHSLHAMQGVRLKTDPILLDSGQAGPVDPNFFRQEPSLDYKASFEPKSSFLDQMVQKLRDHKGLYVFPFPGLIYRYLDVDLKECVPVGMNNTLLFVRVSYL